MNENCDNDETRNRTKYGYDAAGNLISFYDGVKTTTYAYDGESRINSINSGADTYFYGANGDRVRKNVGSAWTEYAYFAGQPIAEKNSNGTWTDYIFAAGQRIAMAASSDQSNPSATTNYYTSDQIGSARMITNGSGGILSNYVFYPFGQGSQPDENHYLFSGKERDSESGLDNFGARYLTSTIGRFMSPDWSAKVDPVPYSKLENPQSLNLYAYAGNNPVGRIDADGHYTCAGTTDQCAEIKTALNLAKTAVKNLGAGSTEGKAIQKVIDLFGAEKKSDAGGIHVSFGALAQGTLGEERGASDGGFNLKLDLSQIDHNDPASGTYGMTERAGVAIHEGQHAVDEKKRGGGTTSRRELMKTETNAYRRESFVHQGLEINSASGLWSNSWNGSSELESDRSAAIERSAAGSVNAECANGGCTP